MESRFTEQLNVMLDPETKVKLVELARQRGQSMSVVVRDLIRRAAEGEATP